MLNDPDKPTNLEKEYRDYANQTGHFWTCLFVQQYIDSKHGIHYPRTGCTCQLSKIEDHPEWDGLDWK